MRNRIVSSFLVSVIILTFVCQVPGTTWGPKPVTCPICKTPNTFQSVKSYGSYIYRWPSKFQLIFWPLTDSPVLYSCRNCRLTCFMGDFEKVPENKYAELKKRLQGVTFDQDYGEYTKIPMSQRLGAAETIYRVLGRDDEFWCRFYRVVGYHLDEENKQKEADEARKKALSIVQGMLDRQEYAERRKELLLISGAMRHFLKDNKGALQDFDEASKLTYRNKKLKREEAEGRDRYLSELLKEYLERIRQERKTPESERRKSKDKD